MESRPLLMIDVYDQMCSMFNGFNKEVMSLFKLARTESIISGILINIVGYNNEYSEIEERVITYLKEKKLFYANKQIAK